MSPTNIFPPSLLTDLAARPLRLSHSASGGGWLQPGLYFCLGLAPVGGALCLASHQRQPTAGVCNQSCDLGAGGSLCSQAAVKGPTIRATAEAAARGCLSCSSLRRLEGV
eukprot:943195-Pelagomonas_calceolata.AAC.3